jgi:NTE family protein
LQTKKLGLALSGGGARGIAHLGVLQALNEVNLRNSISIVSGTSAGSIIASLYAAGKEPKEVLDFLIRTNYLTIFRLATNFKGVLNMKKTEKVFRKIFLHHDTFESLKIPLYVAATCLESGKTEYFSSGNLITIIQASSCIPVIFAPILIQNKHYVDGGLLNNMPSEIIKDKCEYLIGININPPFEKANIPNVRELVERVGYLAISPNVETSKKLCDWVIEPTDLQHFTVFDVGYADEMYVIGYEYTKKLLKTQKLWEQIDITKNSI